MMVRIIVEKCLLCGVCATVCSVNAIDLHGSSISILDAACTNCGLCKVSCPTGAIE